ESNQLTAQSLQIQEEISHTPSSPKRDSLIRASNDLTLQSAHDWQEGLALIQEARKTEPNIEYKMGVNDYAAINKNEKSLKPDLTVENPDNDKLASNTDQKTKSPVTNQDASQGTSLTNPTANKSGNSNTPENNAEANASIPNQSSK